MPGDSDFGLHACTGDQCYCHGGPIVHWTDIEARELVDVLKRMARAELEADKKNAGLINDEKRIRD